MFTRLQGAGPRITRSRGSCDWGKRMNEMMTWRARGAAHTQRVGGSVSARTRDGTRDVVLGGSFAAATARQAGRRPRRDVHAVLTARS